MSNTKNKYLLNEENKRREKFFLFLMSISIPILFFFGIKDVVSGNVIEGLPDIFVSFVMCIITFWFMKRKSKGFLRFVVIIVTVTIFYDIFINQDAEFSWLWLNPLAICFFFLLGKKEAMIGIFFIFIGILVYLYAPFLNFRDIFTSDEKIRFIISWILIVTISYALESAKEKYYKKLIVKHQKLQEEKENLQQALANIKVLNGLLPICANCKKIRDDSGYWSQIELYIKHHSEADFSHSICPDCAKTLYPEFFKVGK